MPGLHGVLEGLVPYTQRHFNRADRLLRSTYLVDYVLGVMNVLTPEEEEGEEAAAGGQQANGGKGWGRQQDGPAPMVEG